MGLLFVSAILIDGSVPGFVGRLQKAIEFGQMLGSGHTVAQILRMDRFELAGKVVFAIGLIGVLVSAAIFSAGLNSKKALCLNGLLVAVFFTVTVLLLFGDFYWAVDFGKFQAALTLGLMGAILFAGLVISKIKKLKNISASLWRMACLFLCFPYIYAFGTHGNYWQAGSAVAIFWLFAGLILLLPWVRAHASWRGLLPLAIATQTVTTIILQAGFNQPYRQPQPQPIRLNDAVLTLGAKPATLVLSKSYAAYISDVARAAKNHAFSVGTPMIDLTGRSPGLLYALGAESIGQAWNVGAYPGSQVLAQAAFATTPCEKIAAAWVLLEPDGPRSLSSELMSGLGATFPSGYTKVAEWQTPEGAGGHAEPFVQMLYKPAASDAVFQACNRLRIKSATL